MSAADVLLFAVGGFALLALTIGVSVAIGALLAMAAEAGGLTATRRRDA